MDFNKRVICFCFLSIFMLEHKGEGRDYGSLLHIAPHRVLQMGLISCKDIFLLIKT